MTGRKGRTDPGDSLEAGGGTNAARTRARKARGTTGLQGAPNAIATKGPRG